MRKEDFIVSTNTSLVDVMKRVDTTAMGIVYVCDSDSRLLGTITDGDVRRTIIANGRLDMIAYEVMKKDPITVTVRDRTMASYVMKKNCIRSVPIIDKDNRVVDICFTGERSRVTVGHEMIDVPVAIMAGGKGTRLQPYTNILPKPLMPIGEKTITEHIIDRFKESGCKRFNMIVNYKKHLIEAYFQGGDVELNIDFVEEEEFLGTAGGLRLIIGKYNETMFVTNCDILIEGDYSDIYEYHKKSNNIATVVCAVKNMKIPYGVIESTDSGRITGIKEKPDISSIVNTGFYVIEPEFLDRIPSGKVSQITDVFQTCIEEGLRVGMYPISEDNWMDMGQFDELRKMTERLEEFK